MRSALIVSQNLQIYNGHTPTTQVIKIAGCDMSPTTYMSFIHLSKNLINW